MASGSVSILRTYRAVSGRITASHSTSKMVDNPQSKGTCREFIEGCVPRPNRSYRGSSGSTVRGIDTDTSRCVLTRRRFHPTKAYFDSWIARIFSLKNSRSRNPYACRFIVLILLLVPSIGPLLIITS